MKNDRKIILTAANYSAICALRDGLLKSINEGGYGTVTSVGDTSVCSKYPGITLEVCFEADSRRNGKTGHVLPFLPAPSKVFSGTTRDLKWDDFSNWTLEQDVEPGYMVAHWQKGKTLHKECYTQIPA